MAKCRIGHFAEAQILQALEIDYIDESEVLTPADLEHHVDKWDFTVPFVCGATNLGEALRRIAEGAAMIRTKGEAGTGDIVNAVTHMRSVFGAIRRLGSLRSEELYAEAKELRAPVELVQWVAEHGKLPVVTFTAGGIATPADAALCMQLGADGVFVGSGIFKSGDPEKRARAIVEATTHFMDADGARPRLGGPRRGDGRHLDRVARAEPAARDARLVAGSASPGRRRRASGAAGRSQCMGASSTASGASTRVVGSPGRLLDLESRGMRAASTRAAHASLPSPQPRPPRRWYDLAVIVALHVATGATAGAAVRSPLAAALLGIPLHLGGDWVPHEDLDSRNFELFSGLALVALLAMRRGVKDAATIGALAASAPDMEHVVRLPRPGGSKLFHDRRGWHRSGGLSTGVQLLAAGFLIGGLVGRRPSR